MNKFLNSITQKQLTIWRNEVTIKAFEDAAEAKKNKMNPSKIQHNNISSNYQLSFSSLASFATEFEKLKFQASNILVSYKSNNPQQYNKLIKDLDFILRLVSKDKEEYQRLKKHIEKILDLMNQNLTNQFNESLDNSFSNNLTENTILDTETNITFNTQSNEYNIQITHKNLEIKLDVSLIPNNLTSNEITSINISANKVKQSDPLVLDLSGNGYDIVNFTEGAMFDINADGKVDKTSWIAGLSGLLVYDKNNNGSIDNGSELFGDQNNAKNGFLELAKYDQDKNKKIDKNDQIYKYLKVYIDLNKDRQIQNNELFSLPSLNIKSIHLNFFKKNQYVNNNKLIFESFYELEDGTKRKIGDFAFNFE